MAVFSKERFQSAYESGASGSYLVITANTMEKIYNYQVEMIANNPRNNILPLSIRKKDGEVSFYYTITSRQPLGQFLKRRELNGNEFVHMISSITRTMLEAKNYLLFDRLFLLDEDFMFINPNTLDVSLVYIPVEMECDAVLNFKEFIVKLIMFTISIDESANALLQKVLIDVKRETFSLDDFDKIVSRVEDKPEDKKLHEENRIEADRANIGGASKQIFRPILGQKQPSQKSVKEDDKEPGFRIPQTNMPEVKVKKAPEPQKTVNNNLTYGNTTVIAAVILQVIVVSLLILTLKSGILDSVAEDTITTYGAFALVLGALDFLAMRGLLHSKNRRIVKNPKQKPEVPIKNYTLPSLEKIEKKGVEPLRKQENKPEAKVAIKTEFRDATALLTKDGNQTIPLHSQSKAHPYLILEESQEKIEINKEAFVIGRLKGHVDYVPKNNAIGKMHAEFIKRNGAYYVKDLNSRNGTFVNDVRIDSNIEYEIRHTDKIVLANSQFTFRISQG